MKKILSLLVVLLPWKIRRWLLVRIWKYEIHPGARIGWAYVYPNHLKMAKGSSIDHLTVAVNLELMVLEENSIISRSNWITGFPKNSGSKHFQHQEDRNSQLIVGRESAITKHHHIDCTNSVIIGKYTTIAGYYSQFLTHSINIHDSIQDSSSIIIGDYCFVGTNSVILGGSSLPSHSVLGAKSLLNKKFTEEFMLYGGAPSKIIKPIDKSAKYFHRDKGFVI